MARELERQVDALLRPLSVTRYLATGSLLAVLRDGAHVVQLDGAGAGLVAVPRSGDRLELGAHVLIERVRDGWVWHGAVPDDVVLEVA